MIRLFVNLLVFIASVFHEARRQATLFFDWGNLKWRESRKFRSKQNQPFKMTPLVCHCLIGLCFLGIFPCKRYATINEIWGKEVKLTLFWSVQRVALLPRGRACAPSHLNSLPQKLRARLFNRRGFFKCIVSKTYIKKFYFGRLDRTIASSCACGFSSAKYIQVSEKNSCAFANIWEHYERNFHPTFMDVHCSVVLRIRLNRLDPYATVY